MISITVASGRTPPKAATPKIRLSRGTLTPLLTSTRAHWWRRVTRVTHRW